MNISSLSQTPAPIAPNQSAVEKEKIAKSCKEFEAMLWRQILESAMAPSIAQPAAGADNTGTYNYFLSNTLAEAVSGGPGSFSSLLQAQLLGDPQIPGSR